MTDIFRVLLRWFASLFASETSEGCLAIIRHYEGLRLDAYLDAVGVPTIGYGDTGPHVTIPSRITREESERRLEDRITYEYTPGVLAALTRRAKPCELDALVSLAYNVGVAAVASSTLVRRFNAGEPCADEFLRWHYADGKSLKGLRRRRETERQRFLGASVAEAIAAGDQVR